MNAIGYGIIALVVLFALAVVVVFTLALCKMTAQIDKAQGKVQDD